MFPLTFVFVIICVFNCLNRLHQVYVYFFSFLNHLRIKLFLELNVDYLFSSKESFQKIMGYPFLVNSGYGLPTHYWCDIYGVHNHVYV
jgi:hypothetical protein